MFHSTLGLLTHNATWCQNRGCICISSTRRTYGRIHAVSCIHPVIQTSTIILWTELFPKKRREKISKERYFKDLQFYMQSSEDPRRDSSFQCFYTQSSNYNYKFNSAYRINSTTRNSKEIQQLQGSFCAGIFQRLLPVYPSILHGRIRLQAPYSVPGPYSTSRLPVILPSRNSILHGSQPSRSPSSDSQAQST